MEKIRQQIIVLFFFYITICNAQISDFKHIDFIVADNTARLHKGKSLKKLRVLCNQLTSELDTDVEKFRAIYTWVSNNIKIDIGMYNTVMRKHRKFKGDSLGFIAWNKSYNKKFAKKLVEKKRTICTGYAHLIRKMARLSGIECKMINGYGRTIEHNFDSFDFVNHSWNAVKLNNKWYLCDGTWSSGYIEDGVFINDYNDGFFLVEPKLFANNHFPKDKKWLLSATNPEVFLNAPLLYSENFKYKIIPVLPKTMKVLVKKKEEIQFQFKALKSINTKDISLVYFNSNGYSEKEYTYQIYDISNIDNIIRFKHKFKHRGIYDIHLKIKNDIVISYSVKVEK